MYSSSRAYPPIYPYGPYPVPGQIHSSYPPMHPYPPTSQFYPHPLSYPPIHPYPVQSQIHSSYPPMRTPTPSQTDLSSSYSPSLPSEASEETPEEERGDPDKSEALFSMYLDRSDEDDKKTTERWKGECDAILIFTGLFSAALAALLSISVPGLQRNPQDTSAFYLGNIYHLLAGTTGSQPIVPPTPSDPPKFSPPTSAVLVNSLWFLSLVMSLTGALIAVFIQQWAQTYLEATQGRHNPKLRARIRTFYAEGLDKLYLHRVTRAVPILIHVSLFLFFSGLPIFLFNLNRTVFNVVVAWLAICVAGYACITLMPIICQDSPYYSPLSSSTWWCAVNTLFILHRLFKNFIPRDSFVLRWYDAHYAESQFRWPTLRAMQRVGERFARKLPSEIDYRALSWMFKTLNDNDEFEEFFDALPSLCDSKELKNAQTAFIRPNKKILSHALIGMMDRTLLSELVSEEVKQRRIIICTKVIDASSLLEPLWILRRVLFGDWIGFSRSIHFGLFVQNWKNISDSATAFYAQFVVAVTLASVQERDDHWFKLASGQLYESKSFLRNYYAKDDSILLANVIFIIRRTIQTFSKSENLQQRDIDVLEVSSTLELICRFNIQNTFPEHQHEFCSLWNQLVEAAQAPQNDTNAGVSPLCVMMLKSIRRLYVTLHGYPSTPHVNPSTLHENPSILYENPSTHLADSTPYYQAPSLNPPSTHLADSTPYYQAPSLNPSTYLANSTPYYQAPSLNPSTHLANSTPYYQAPSLNPSTHLTNSTPYYQGQSLDPSAQLAASTPYRYGVLDDARSYTKCTVGEHRHSTPVPELPLDGLPEGAHKVSMDKIRELTSFLVPVMSPTYTTPKPVFQSPANVGLSLTANQTATSHLPNAASSYHPVGLGLDSVVPDTYSRPGHPASPSVSPVVPSPQIVPNRIRRRVPENAAESGSRLDENVFHASPPSTPKVPRRRRVGFVGVTAPTPRTSLPALPALQEPPADSDKPISTPASAGSTPFIPPKEIMPDTPFVPRLPSLESFSVPQGPPVVENANLEKKSTAPTPFDSPVDPSPTSQKEGIPPVPSPSRGSIATPPQVHQPVSVSPPGASIPVQVPLDTGSSHSTTDMSFATAPSASSSPVPFITPMTMGSRSGSPAQTPLSIPSVIEVNGYGEFSGLLHHSLHSVLYEDELYPTALHLFEALKFLPDRPDLADRVRQCERVQQVDSISAELANFARQDWANIRLSMMDTVLHLKFRQHTALRTLLFSTYPAELVYVEPSDLSWGGDGGAAGRNELGKSLMRVRDRLRIEGGMSSAMPPPDLGNRASVASVLKFNGYGEYSGLLYHSPHSVVYEEDLYPTALHLFEARKFLDHRPDLADRIRECEDVEDVSAISAELAEFTRRDWGNDALITMEDVLYLKFSQHKDLCTLLLNTYPADLVYVESGDPFWGDGAGGGMNELGKSLMRVRERLRITNSSYWDTLLTDRCLFQD